MKILIAGDWHSELHEEVVFHALQSLGHTPIRFAWHDRFRKAGVLSILAKAQNKWLFGPLLRTLNEDFLRLARHTRPDCIFFYRNTHIFPQTLRQIRESLPSTCLVSYNNDDPFAPSQNARLWKYFLEGIPFYDLVLAYRPRNLEEFKRAGARHVDLLMPWYTPERNRPVTLTVEEQKAYGCDVVFVGHYEDDGRLQLLERLSASGVKLRLFGPGYEWDAPLGRSKALRALAPVRLVWGEDYNKALCGAKIALCFFSRLNRDAYTRRCFEIPATKTLLLSEYSKELGFIFEEDKEAAYFRSPETLVEKAKFYLNQPGQLRAVAEAGYRKVTTGGHNAEARMANVVQSVQKILQTEGATHGTHALGH